MSTEAAGARACAEGARACSYMSWRAARGRCHFKLGRSEGPSLLAGVIRVPALLWPKACRLYWWVYEPIPVLISRCALVHSLKYSIPFGSLDECTADAQPRICQQEHNVYDPKHALLCLAGSLLLRGRGRLNTTTHQHDFQRSAVSANVVCFFHM